MSAGMSRRDLMKSVGAGALAMSLGKNARGDDAMESKGGAEHKGIFNVHSFGAKGEGRTDDTLAIQRAVDAAAETTGEVYFPAGVYLCSTLKAKPHVTLRGCATWSYSPYRGSLIRLVDDKARCLLDMTGAKGAVLDGLALDGWDRENKRRVGDGIHGIMVDRAAFDDGGREDAIRIERSNIRNFSGDGVHLNRIWVFTIRHSMVNNNLVNGVYVHGWDGFILDCWLTANRKAGYGADKPSGAVTMTGNRVEWNREGGMVIRGGEYYNVTGNYFDRSGGPGIWLRGGRAGACRHFAITGNVIRRSGAFSDNLPEHADSHAFFESGRGIVLSGNTMGAGRNDDGTGKLSPAYGIVYGRLEHSIIKDNALYQGATKELFFDGGRHGDGVVVKDNVGSLAVGEKEG